MREMTFVLWLLIQYGMLLVFLSMICEATHGHHKSLLVSPRVSLSRAYTEALESCICWQHCALCARIYSWSELPLIYPSWCCSSSCFYGWILYLAFPSEFTCLDLRRLRFCCVVVGTWRFYLFRILYLNHLTTRTILQIRFFFLLVMAFKSFSSSSPLGSCQPVLVPVNVRSIQWWFFSLERLVHNKRANTVAHALILSEEHPKG